MSFVGPSSEDISAVQRIDNIRNTSQNTYATPDEINRVIALKGYYNDISPGLAIALGKGGFGPNDKIAQRAWQAEVTSRIGQQAGVPILSSKQASVINRILKSDISPEAQQTIYHGVNKYIRGHSDYSSFSEMLHDVHNVAAADALNKGGGIGDVLVPLVTLGRVNPGANKEAAKRGYEIKSPLSDVPVAREAFTAAQTGYDATTAFVREGWKYLGQGVSNIAHGRLPSDTGPDNEADLNPLQNISEIPEQTTGYQHYVKGLSTGEGLFPDPQSPAMKAQAEAARKYSPYLIGGHAFTPGRAIADVFFTPDTVPFQLLSGAVDAQVALKADPTNMLLAGTSTARATARQIVSDTVPDIVRGAEGSAELPTALDRISRPIYNAAGAFYDHRPKIAPTIASDYLSSDGRPAMKYLSDATSPHRIVVDSKGQIPYDIAAKFADNAHTPEAAADIFRSEIGKTFNQKLNIVKNRTTSKIFDDMPVKQMVVGPDGDKDAVINESVLHMSNSKVPEPRIEEIANEMARTPTEDSTGWHNMMGKVLDAMGESYKARGMHSDLIDDALVRMKDDFILHDAFTVDSLGNPILQTRQVVTNGEVFALPHPGDERTIFGNIVEMPDPRQIRRDVSTYNELWNNEYVRKTVDLADHMMNYLKRIWIIRPATTIRVVGEEQVRIAVAGYAGLFNHPLTAMSYIIGSPDNHWIEMMSQRKITQPIGKALETVEQKFARNPYELGNLTANGDPLREGMYLQDRFSTIAGRNTRYKSGMFRMVDRTDPEASRALGQEIVLLRQDEIKRSIAERGYLQTRQELIDGDLSHVPLHGDPSLAGQVADRTILADSELATIRDNFKNTIGDNPVLLEAVKTGKINGVWLTKRNGAPSAAARAELQKVIDESQNLPDNWRLLRTGTQHGNALRKNALDGGLDYMLTLSMSRPSDFLSRNNLLQQKYLQYIKEIFPHVDAEGRAKLLSEIPRANISKADRITFETMNTRLNRLESDLAEQYGTRIRPVKTYTPTLSYDAATKYASARSVKETKDLLYDLSRRGRLTDMLRIMVPFGEAYKEVTTRWAGLLWNNPNVIRRFQQGVTAAREPGTDWWNKISGVPTDIPGGGPLDSRGMFYKDEYNQEVVAYPGTSFLNDKLWGLPIPLKGSVQNANLVGNGMPGLGPVVQLPLAHIIPNKPGWDSVRNLIFPYGAPKGENIITQLANSAAPGWVNKFTSALTANENTNKAYSSAIIDTASYLASTGEYQLQGPNAQAESTRLMDDATHGAKMLGMTRALGQLSLPSAPSEQWVSEDKSGRLALMFATRDWYYKRVNHYNRIGEANAPQKAAEDFLDRFGVDNFLLIQPKSKSTIPAGPTHSQSYDWIRNHPAVVKQYPNTYALFAGNPQGGEISSEAMQSEINKGNRVKFTTKEALNFANERLANIVYNKVSDSIGPKRTPEDIASLRELRGQLTKEFPGYNTQDFPYVKQERLIAELQDANRDPFLRRTDAGKALSQYLHYRDQILAIGGGTIGGVKNADLRAFLGNLGLQLESQHPGFAPMWDSVFANEVKI